MKRQYPYLINTVTDSENEAARKRSFLSKLDNYAIQKRYVRITLLDWHEQAIKEISGELTGGTLTKDGASAMRRTCSLTASVGGGDYDVNDAQMDFSINKKVYLETGIQNQTDEYTDYPILWFPQGTFFIFSCSVTSGTNAPVNLSLTLHDKMAGLNGEVGGTFPSAIDLDVETTEEDGQVLTKKVKLYNLIQELVNHWGGEDLNNIMIEDVDLQIRRVIKWNGENSWYMKQDEHTWEYSLTPKDGYTEYKTGSDIGYMWEDFVYTDDLSMNAGETVVTALDKIKSYLGNYEYFYDINGVFHFRQIRDYTNTSQVSFILDEGAQNGYLLDVTNGEKQVYSFKDETNISNLSVSPQYNNIKNDFVVNGLKKSTTSDISYPIMYHVIIDSIPTTDSTYRNFILYKDSIMKYHEAAYPLWLTELPAYGHDGTVYALLDSRPLDFIQYYLDDSTLETKFNELKDLFNNEGSWSMDTLVKAIYNKSEEVRNWIVDNHSDVYKIDNEDASEKETAYINLGGLKAASRAFDMTVGNYPVLVEQSDGTISEAWIDGTNGQKLSYLSTTKEDVCLNMLSAISLSSLRAFYTFVNMEWEKLTDVYDYYDTPYQINNWRTAMYLQSVLNAAVGQTPVNWGEAQYDPNTKTYYYSDDTKYQIYDTNSYAAELISFWPGMYDLVNGCYWDNAESDGIYFLDFIDPKTCGLSAYSVANIGRRTNVTNNDDINCLWDIAVPTIVFINNGDDDVTAQISQCQTQGYDYCLIDGNVYAGFATGGSRNPAFDQIKYDIYSHTNYQRNVNITALPVDYLEPNSYVDIADYTTNTNANFMIKNISLPLKPGSTMSVTANEIFDRV